MIRKKEDRALWEQHMARIVSFELVVIMGSIITILQLVLIVLKLHRRRSSLIRYCQEINQLINDHQMDRIFGLQCNCS